ncbi:MAG: HAD hydrolase-like protein [Candidatus Muirbacterium halophilum]|nr:HAD hydrolase-like protein [Candidatus Muirbacterium halophilum]MCK9475376.1 HAD hydrolase-like protein [Candidatus Muirbacterium halophilum]
MKILLFDIDGTIVDVKKSGQKALFDAFLEVTGQDCSKINLCMAGKTDAGIIKIIMEAFKVDNSQKNFIITNYIKNLENNMKIINSFIMPGVMEIINFIKQKDYYVPGLLTGNMYDGARLKLEYFELFKYFPFGAYGDNHCNRNDLAIDALKRLKHLYGDESFSNEDIIIIGDTPMDIECGKSINAKTIAVATGPYSMEELAEHKPDLLCDTLENTSEIITFINKSSI